MVSRRRHTFGVHKGATKGPQGVKSGRLGAPLRAPAGEACPLFGVAGRVLGRPDRSAGATHSGSLSKGAKLVPRSAPGSRLGKATLGLVAPKEKNRPRGREIPFIHRIFGNRA